MYPCIAWAIYCILYILYVTCLDFGGPWNEMRGLGTIITVMWYGPQFFLASLLGFLFWRAFK